MKLKISNSQTVNHKNMPIKTHQFYPMLFIVSDDSETEYECGTDSAIEDDEEGKWYT